MSDDILAVASLHFLVRLVWVFAAQRYTETIKLCPLDVYVFQFQIDERISFKVTPYKRWSFRNDLHPRVIRLIISRAAEKAANTSTLK